MAEVNLNEPKVFRKLRHRGRMSQIPIYFGKQLRFFVNQSDWKVIPMAAIIAFLVGMVIRNKIFISMEGTLIGAFALACVGIWNGCFNSIQSVCRERPIIKREHRSGMHISSYIFAHMMYQMLLCLAQTGITLYVLILMDVPFPETGFMTPWMVVDIGITLLMITYASDMMSLFISSICHTTTGAMTVMPFVLIFQLVFSGGFIPLPAFVKPLANFTISNYGIKAITSQCGYNELPMKTAWDTLDKMRDKEIGGTVTLGQIMDLLDSKAVEKRRDMEIMKSFTVGEVADILSKADDTLHLRDKEVTHSFTLRELLTDLKESENFQQLRDFELVPAAPPVPVEEAAELPAEAAATAETAAAEPPAEEAPAEEAPAEEAPAEEAPAEEVPAEEAPDEEVAAAEPAEEAAQPGVTVGSMLDKLLENEDAKAFLDKELGANMTLGQVLDALHAEDIIASMSDKQLNQPVTLGQAVDFLVNNEALKQQSSREFTFKTTISELFDLVGEEKVKTIVQEATASASRNPDYDRTVENIVENWIMLLLFVLVFSTLATISLEFIDKDRR